MNNWLPLAAVVLASGKGKQQSTDVFETLMLNEMPKAPRAVLSVTQAVDRSNLQAAQQKAAAEREVALAVLIDEGKLRVGADLSNDSRIQYMVQRISDESLKQRVITKLGSPEDPATRTRGTPPHSRAV